MDALRPDVSDVGGELSVDLTTPKARDTRDRTTALYVASVFIALCGVFVLVVIVFFVIEIC